MCSGCCCSVVKKSKTLQLLIHSTYTFPLVGKVATVANGVARRVREDLPHGERKIAGRVEQQHGVQHMRNRMGARGRAATESLREERPRKHVDHPRESGEDNQQVSRQEVQSATQRQSEESCLAV